MEKIYYPYRSSFLKQQALDAWNYFQKIGYPQSKDENWRFSNTNAWLLHDAPIVTSGDKFIMEEFSQYIIPNTSSIFILNDSVVMPDRLPVDIEVLNINQTIKKDSANITIGSVASYDNNPFIAENMALFQNGCVVNIPENTIIEKPLHIIHDIKGKEDNRVYPRLFINIGAGSEVKILQTDLGSDNHHHFINSVDEFVINENAKLDLMLIQQRNSISGQICSINMSLERNATVSYNTFEFGSGFIRRDINAYFNGTGGDFEFNCLFLPTDKQHMDISSMIHHRSAKCNSRQLVKGVLGGSARGVFRGLAHVYHQASKTDAKQTNHNLLLSSKARMNSIPRLEIHDDDVRCAHGSTTGQIDEEAIFYLRSRGINKISALELMVEGFVNEVINKIKDTEFKTSVKKNLMQKMKDII